MVRLKKKRFIVIDYGIVPTLHDIASASMNAHVTCPPGAGKQICTTSDCHKIGVPVLLYDSDPDQPHSLYIRLGLCFTCQRLLNEKRRTQRKRKSDITPSTSTGHSNASARSSSSMMMCPSSQHPHSLQESHHHSRGTTTTDIHAIPMDSTSSKRFRLNGEILDLAPDAIIINGPLVGTKHQGPNYGYMDIGNDLLHITKESFEEFQKLISAVTKQQQQNNTHNHPNNNHSNANDSHPTGKDDTTQQSQQKSPLTTASTTAPPPPTSVIDNYEILSYYEKTFLSMSKGIFLLSQWKASWDLMTAANVSTNMMTETANSFNHTSFNGTNDTIKSSTKIETTIPTNPNNVPPPPSVITTVSDSELLASAAAVAAAQQQFAAAVVTSTTTIPTTTTTTTYMTDTNTTTADASTTSSNNMVPLLLAAQSKTTDNNNTTTAQQQDTNHLEASIDTTAPNTKVFGV